MYLLAFVMVLQVLSFLFTAWSVSFKALVNYRPVASLEDADYVQVRRTSSSLAGTVVRQCGSSSTELCIF